MKPKKPIEVGAKVRFCHGQAMFHIGVVKSSAGSNGVMVVKDLDSNETLFVHRRQITRVIRKKKKEKRVPRTVFFNEYRENDKVSIFSLFLTKEDVDLASGPLRIRCVEFKEVLKDE